MVDSVVLCKSENNKRYNEIFLSLHQKKGGLTVSPSNLCIHTSCPTQEQGKGHSATGEPGYLGDDVPPQRWWHTGAALRWSLCNEAGNTFCSGITPCATASTKQKNLKMQSWGAWARFQALYYMKRGRWGKNIKRNKKKKERKRMQWWRLRYPSASFAMCQSCCCFPILPTAGSNLTTSSGEGMRSQTASDMLARFISWWWYWSVQVTSNIKSYLAKIKHEAQCREPHHSIQGWWVPGSGGGPLFQLFGPVQTTLFKLSLISQLEQGSLVIGGSQEQTPLPVHLCKAALDNT